MISVKEGVGESNKKMEKQNNAEEFFHHSNLFWLVTSIFTVALGGLLLFLQEKPDLGLSILGVMITAILVYFACSFRVLKQEAFVRARQLLQLEKNKTHLDQWELYLLIWLGMGIFFLKFVLVNLIMVVKDHNWHYGSFYLLSVALLISLICYICYFGKKYDKTESLRRFEENQKKITEHISQ